MNYRRLTKYYLLRFLRIATSPLAAAGGFACGTIVHFYPTSGFGLAFALFLAKLTRTSCIASSLAWALTMPLVPIMFYLNFVTGDLFLGITTEDILTAVKDLATLKFSGFWEIGKTFIIGSIINGILGLMVLWFLGFLFLKRYRQSALKFVRKYL
ncbi:MAG: uncharacterized protein PWQ67_294 [Clostridia bacterium]|nr:uncharacterized protein [Clostridia bacterium]